MNPLIMNPNELGEEMTQAAQEENLSSSPSGYIAYLVSFLARLLYVMIKNNTLESDRDVWYIIYGRRY